MFEIRMHAKSDLALLYCPQFTLETAMKTLYRWIKGFPLLMQEVEGMDYNPSRRTFRTPKVRAIVKQFGES